MARPGEDGRRRGAGGDACLGEDERGKRKAEILPFLYDYFTLPLKIFC
jgi:hypothetical protein